MAANIIDAFFVSFAIDAKGFTKGEQEIDQANKRLRENNKKTFTEMEARGKSAASTFKSVRNEVVGLGLAFMGAQSIAGFITNMMTGAASADRLGNTMGMATEKVWAWRMAMKTAGGSVADGDAALSSVQRDKMGYRLGQLGGDKLNTYGRLGITGHDLREADPGEILKKLAKMQPKMDGQLYSNLLQQIGMPASTIAFLQEGKGSVDKLISQFEKDADGQEKLAKETEELQKSLVELQATITGALVPVLKDLVHGVRQILSLFGYGNPDKGNNRPTITGRAGHGGPDLPQYTAAQVHSAAGRPVSAETLAYINAGRGPAARGPSAQQTGDDNIVRYFMSKGLSHDQALGIRAGIHAEGGLQTPRGGGHKGRAIGIGQLLGPRRAAFLKRYGNNFTLQNQLDFMWWELQGGDPGGQDVLKQKTASGTFEAMIHKFYRPAKGRETIEDLSRGTNYLRSHRHGGTTINVTNNNNIRAVDPKGTAREIEGLSRRSAVSQADRGVAP